MFNLSKQFTIIQEQTENPDIAKILTCFTVYSQCLVEFNATYFK